jgi:hypothetical protein
MMINYLSLRWYTHTTIDLDILEVKQKVLNLYPKSEEIISFDFDEVDIVSKVNN